MNKEEYSRLLLSPKWRKRRIQILERDNYTCQLCGSKKVLHVHHKCYVNGRNPWDYPDEILITLCSICHMGLHEMGKVAIYTEESFPLREKVKKKKSSQKKLVNKKVTLKKKPDKLKEAMKKFNISKEQIDKRNKLERDGRLSPTGKIEIHKRQSRKRK